MTTIAYACKHISGHPLFFVEFPDDGPPVARANLDVFDQDQPCEAVAAMATWLPDLLRAMRNDIQAAKDMRSSPRERIEMTPMRGVCRKLVEEEAVI